MLVHFFGDGRVGYVLDTEIYDFSKSFEAVQSTLAAKRKPRGYVTGLVELEVDSTHSIFNKI